jgi:hypothetical protein
MINHVEILKTREQYTDLHGQVTPLSWTCNNRGEEAEKQGIHISRGVQRVGMGVFKWDGMSRSVTRCIK